MKLGVLIDGLGNFVGDYLQGMAIPAGHEIVAPPPDGVAPATYNKTAKTWAAIRPVLLVDQRRSNAMAKWDAIIATKREKVRQLQDEDKPALTITNAKTDLKKAITDRNTELGAIV